jgi:hypothetical protein
VQHRVDRFSSLLGRDGEAEAVPVDPERHEVTGTQRHVRVEQNLLGDVTDRRVPVGSGRPKHEHASRARTL